MPGKLVPFRLSQIHCRITFNQLRAYITPFWNVRMKISTQIFTTWFSHTCENRWVESGINQIWRFAWISCVYCFLGWWCMFWICPWSGLHWSFYFSTKDSQFCFSRRNEPGSWSPIRLYFSNSAKQSHDRPFRLLVIRCKRTTILTVSCLGTYRFLESQWPHRQEGVLSSMKV